MLVIIFVLGAEVVLRKRDATPLEQGLLEKGYFPILRKSIESNYVEMRELEQIYPCSPIRVPL